jgi:hypothetical protein
MLTALVLAQAMGGAVPSDTIGLATAACTHKLAQMAARYGIVDLSSQAISPIQRLDDKLLVRLTVTIRYNRKHGIESRRAVVGCLVDASGRVEILEALLR